MSYQVGAAECENGLMSALSLLRRMIYYGIFINTIRISTAHWQKTAKIPLDGDQVLRRRSKRAGRDSFHFTFHLTRDETASLGPAMLGLIKVIKLLTMIVA